MRVVLAIILSTWVAAQAARAAEQEPQVYFFWAPSCSYCDEARLFMDKARAEDPKIQVRDFEVENNLGNFILFIRVYERIGMPGFGVIPLVVVGPHVIVGYDDEAGRKVLRHIQECREKGCRDIVQDLIREPSDDDAAAAMFVAPPPCTTRVAFTVAAR